MKQLTDITAPAKVERKVLEADVQKQCVDWARARGYWARKFSSISQRSVPDYLFSRAADEPWCSQPTVFAVEFKAPGKTSTKQQVDEQRAMEAAGWTVFQCDDFERFKQLVLTHERRELS